MAAAWVKSLHCKSTAFHDVSHPKSSKKTKPLLPISPPPPSRRHSNRSDPSLSPSSSSPTPTELPTGHPSRRVVEIIFSSTWSPSPFPGQILALFRVHNPPRVLSRFETYREAVRSAAGDDARCAADGNEMMRFRCAGDRGVVPDGASGIRTFAGSGGAHDSGGGGRGGRRAMVVCRVVAGRVRSGADGPVGRFESVSVGRGEILVFDPRAVLPCFLIVYKV